MLKKVLDNWKTWTRRRGLHNSFLKNVSILAGGTAFSQAILILSMPFITRMYSPESFGVFAVFSSILSIITVMASLRYELAIPLPEHDEKAIDLLKLSFILVLFISSLLVLLLYFFEKPLVIWFHLFKLQPYLWWLPIGLCGAGMYQALAYWITRKKLFSVIGYTKGLQSLGQVVIQFVGGFFHLGAISLIVGYIVSQFLGIGSLFKKGNVSRTLQQIQYSRIKNTALEYKSFPCFTLMASLINIIGLQVPPVLIANYFSTVIAGYFSLAMKILAVPAALVGQAVGQVFYSSITQQDASETRKSVEQLAAQLFIISFGFFSFIFLHGDYLFSFVFGPQWSIAGEYAQYLTIWFIFNFISSPLSTIVFIKGKQKTAFFITFYETGIRILSLYVGHLFNNDLLAILLFAFSGSIISTVYIGWVLHLVGSSIGKLIKEMKYFILSSFVLLSVLYSVHVLLKSLLSIIIDFVVLSLLIVFFSIRKANDKRENTVHGS